MNELITCVRVTPFFNHSTKRAWICLLFSINMYKMYLQCSSTVGIDFMVSTYLLLCLFLVCVVSGYRNRLNPLLCLLVVFAELNIQPGSEFRRLASVENLKSKTASFLKTGLAAHAWVWCVISGRCAPSLSEWD